MSSLLSRYAESVFWMARYFERAESLARVIETQTSFQRGRSDNSWAWIVALYSDEKGFAKAFSEPNAENVIRYYMAGPWPELRDGLNAILRGWDNYFCYGTRWKTHRAVDRHVVQNVRRFLVRRHKVQSRGTVRFSREAIFEARGVLSLVANKELSRR